MPNLIDLTGKRYGRLVVLRLDAKEKGKARWICQCDCGNVVSVFGNNLPRGNTKSCGCIFREKLIARNTSHDKSCTPEYVAWCKMKERCNNPQATNYIHYGGRGITICQRWNDSFELFLEDMGNRPSSKHSLDRFPDNDGNYEPRNCRWATKTEQANNTRGNHLLTGGGQTKTITEWSRILGCAFHTITERLRRGWSEERAVTTPIQTKHRRKISQGDCCADSH